jgi:arsenate reductase-like glutaredoxin family protein
MTRPNIIGRAFELAHSPHCGSLKDVLRTLRNEGFERVADHFAGGYIRGELRQVLSAKAQRDRQEGEA